MGSSLPPRCTPIAKETRVVNGQTTRQKQGKQPPTTRARELQGFPPSPPPPPYLTPHPHPRLDPANVRSTTELELATSSARMITLAVAAPLVFGPPDRRPSHVWSRPPTTCASAHSDAPWKSWGRRREEEKGRRRRWRRRRQWGGGGDGGGGY